MGGKQHKSEAVRLPNLEKLIDFTGSVTGELRARIAGTGIEVWEVITSYKSMSNDFAVLCENYHWLSEDQLKAALEYYESHREEIDERIERDERWTPETIAERYPFLRRDLVIIEEYKNDKDLTALTDLDGEEFK